MQDSKQPAYTQFAMNLARFLRELAASHEKIHKDGLNVGVGVSDDEPFVIFSRPTKAVELGFPDNKVRAKIGQGARDGDIYLEVDFVANGNDLVTKTTDVPPSFTDAAYTLAKLVYDFVTKGHLTDHSLDIVLKPVITLPRLKVGGLMLALDDMIFPGNEFDHIKQVIEAQLDLLVWQAAWSRGRHEVAMMDVTAQALNEVYKAAGFEYKPDAAHAGVGSHDIPALQLIYDAAREASLLHPWEENILVEVRGDTRLTGKYVYLPQHHLLARRNEQNLVMLLFWLPDSGVVPVIPRERLYQVMSIAGNVRGEMPTLEPLPISLYDKYNKDFNSLFEKDNFDEQFGQPEAGIA